MQIYPSEHNITVSEEITLNHIPLAYFQKAERNILPSINIEPKFFKYRSEEKIYPYQQFDTDNVILFNENNEQVDSSKYLKRNGNKLYFEPIGAIEFNPTEFEYSILFEKNDKYNNSIKYDINIAAYSEILSENLIGLFNGKNKIKPLNIHINKDNLLPMSMLNQDIDRCNLIFIHENDILSNPGLIDEFLEKNINVWILGNNFDSILKNNENIEDYTLKHKNVYNNDTYSMEGYSRVYFDLTEEISWLPSSIYGRFIKIFETYNPIALLKKEDKGFIILSHDSIASHTDTCGQIIIEIIMQTFLNGYFKTSPRIGYIADDKIDYFLKVNNKFNQYHPIINIYDICCTDGLNPAINSFISKFIVNDESIKFLGQNKHGDILLKKTKRTDPKKTDGNISVFTSKNTIINYNLVENVIKTIEEKLKIQFKQINERNYIIISPFISSSLGINMAEEKMIELPDLKNYTVYYKDGFNIIPSDIYNEKNHGIKIAKISFTLDEEISCRDIRTIGGGECSNITNYEMIDTGSIKGRPYRIGSTMIIKLPSRFRKYKDKIMSEIKKHISSADYPILVFEE